MPYTWIYLKHTLWPMLHAMVSDICQSPLDSLGKLVAVDIPRDWSTWTFTVNMELIEALTLRQFVLYLTCHFVAFVCSISWCTVVTMMLKYCWWKTSCTSWYGKKTIIYRVSYMSGAAGFLPSTVCWNYCCLFWLRIRAEVCLVMQHLGVRGSLEWVAWEMIVLSCYVPANYHMLTNIET